ncbi:hypothetical protein L3Q65_00100 (plasmid) [Amycolatopsis sp. FU40]|uniref:hypothetical protein n=1 Tax=Amycolatopsis sp. FU40 TaxID=2914159 RepID=UPI001F287D85|nr:hypothetical protein [Amycolatopsis sp. FU40]UKD50761.1 hypothetical protein L3Q65_00100 [Amycolatopsis sp. FU40]
MADTAPDATQPALDQLWDDYDRWIQAVSYESDRAYDEGQDVRAVQTLAAEAKQLLDAAGAHPSDASDTAVVFAGRWLPRGLRPATFAAYRRERAGTDGLAATVAELREHYRQLHDRPARDRDRYHSGELAGLLDVMRAIGYQITEPHPAWPGGWILRLSRPGTPDYLLARQIRNTETRTFRTLDAATAAAADSTEHPVAPGVLYTPAWSPVSGCTRPSPLDAGAWTDTVDSPLTPITPAPH